MDALPALQRTNIIDAGGQVHKLNTVLKYLPKFRNVQSFHFEAYANRISEDKLRRYCSEE